jgi:hypothetical protein
MGLCSWLYYNRLLSELNLARERGIMLRQVENPRFYEKAIEIIRVRQGQLSKKQKGSRSREKARVKLGRPELTPVEMELLLSVSARAVVAGQAPSLKAGSP